MSPRAVDRLAAVTAETRTNPFGAASPATEPQHTVTMADAVRRCRWIAVDINAASFMLFFVSPDDDKRQLILVFDSDYPAQSAISRLIASRIAEETAVRATRSTRPFWWPSTDPARFEQCFASVDWAEGPIVAPTEDAGMVFPVYADRGQVGVVVFHGSEIVLDNDMLFETHARSFALFSAVTRLRPLEGGKGLTVSKRELECLSLTANGLTSEEIAAELKLSVHTANQYLTNTTQKLNAVNRMQAVAKALRLGLID
jgi:DNA-binding CsgD family transcriptional regulator